MAHDKLAPRVCLEQQPEPKRVEKPPEGSVREVEGRVQWFGRTTIGVGSAHIMVCAVNKMSWKSDVVFHANVNISSWCGIPG